ncbi:MAG: hypothetical protein K1Y02_16670 [Candidatus Hydrogenedentes bacterium]|nr:hypothetical protein [Candidatus Hydrogenedentota bacterium]
MQSVRSLSVVLGVGLFFALAVGWAGEANERVRFTNTVASITSKNLVPNGSFEVGECGWSSLGRGAGFENAWAPLVPNWGNFATLHGSVETSGGAEGNAFLRIPLGGENTPEFNFDYFRPVVRKELRPLAANLGWIEVTPGKPLTLSVYMRASRDGVPALFGVQNEDPSEGWGSAQEEVLQAVTLTAAWQRYSHTFSPKYPFLFVVAGPNLAEEETVFVDVDAVQLEKGDAATEFAPRSGLEIGVVPVAPAGVFTVGETASLKIAAYNSASKPANADIVFEATDYFGAAVDFPPVDLEIPANSSIEKIVELPDQRQGFYRVTAKYACGKKEESRLLRIAIVPAQSDEETVIGVNHAYPTAELVGLAKKAGVSWYRDWSLKWQHIEPEKGQYRWDISDPQMNRVGAQGAKLMAMIPFPSADWNSTAPSLEALQAESSRYKAGGQGDDQELIPRARWAWPPQDANELAGFATAAVGRYKEQVQVWEFLNEPLFTLYSLPDSSALNSTTLKSFTIDDYLRLLRVVAPAIRAANPNARIMGGPGMFFSGRYTIPMVEAGILDLVDIYGVHDYPGKVPPEERFSDIEGLRTAMKAHGGPKPMWMTEFSYFGTDDLPRQPFRPIPGTFSEPRLLSEKEVGDRIVRYSTIFLGRGGEKVFLHSGCTGSVNKPGTESCLFADGAVRKAFVAVAVFTQLMGPKPEYVEDVIDAGGCHWFAFRNGDRAIHVLWDPSGNATAKTPEGMKCLNVIGQVVDTPEVRLSESPIYFVGPAGDIRRPDIALKGGSK